MNAFRRAAGAARTRPRLAVALLLVVIAGAGLRLIGSNWDGTAHLHPDERYLSIVADDISWPHSISRYLDVRSSPLSPYLTPSGTGYVYGTLPLFATKLVAGAVGRDRYEALNVVGRRLGALLDTATILLVFLIALRLLRPLGGSRPACGAVLAAALYAFTVTAIQHSHFFTVDVWLVFFGTSCFLLGMVAITRGTTPERGRRWPILVLVGATFGLTVGCKLSGVLIAVPLAFAFAGRAAIVARASGWTKAALGLTAEVGVAALAAYVSFRAVSPYVFARSNWLDVSLNGDFREAVRGQADAASGAFLFPPAYQWLLSRPVWGPLENLVAWQLGIPLGIAALAGLGVLIVRLVRTASGLVRRRSLDDEGIAAATSEAMVAGFSLAVFFYFSSQFAHTGRYLLALAPFLAVTAAFGLTVLAGRWPTASAAVALVLVATTALWAVAFVHVYTSTDTHLAASAWLATNVHPGEAIANEHWDYPLPIGGAWIDPKAPADAEPTTGYRGILLPVFDPDSPAKLRTLHSDLAVANYYVLSSPRAWRTVGRLPDRFPLMTRFYEKLFAGELGFREVASFASVPRLAGVKVDDLRAEEAFWVYDHAPVRIFRRDGPLTWKAFRAALCEEPVPSYCA